jgi:hypothetical protein
MKAEIFKKKLAKSIQDLQDHHFLYPRMKDKSILTFFAKPAPKRAAPTNASPLVKEPAKKIKTVEVHASIIHLLKG